MAGTPAWQFYGGDWKKDPNLAKCSLATRGFWLEICDAMQQNRDYQLKATYAELALIARCSEAEARSCVAQLRDCKAADARLSRYGVTLICRRYKKEVEEKKRDRDRKRNSRCNELVRGSSPSSSSSSSSSNQEGRKEGAAPPPEPPATQFPEAHAEINRHFPGTAPGVTEKIAQAARRVDPRITDSAMALAIRVTHWEGQQQPWAWRTKVPEYLRSVPPDERGLSPGPHLMHKPPARSHARDPAARSAGLQLGIDLIRAEYLAAEAAGGE